MRLEFTKTGKSFNVKDSLGAILMNRGLARQPVAAGASRIATQALPTQTAALKAEPDAEISARTGKPKRAYLRRDMKAEE